MLAANSGFNLESFAAFLATIINRRLETVQQQRAGSVAAVSADGSATGGFIACQFQMQPQPQLQLLHCALDLARASSVLQQVRDAYVTAAAHNVAWWQKHIARKQPAGLMNNSADSGSSSGQVQHLELPGWVQVAEELLQVSSRTVTQLRMLV